MANTLINNQAMCRYELPIAGGAVAVAYYTIENDRIILRHTEVPHEFGGKGIGTRLAHGVFEQLKTEGKRVIATCTFMSAYATRHPEYARMLDD